MISFHDLAEVLEQRGDSVALVSCDGLTLTYRMLGRRVAERTQLLRRKKFNRGRRAGVLCARAEDSIITLLSLLALECVVVPLPPAITTVELEKIQRACGLAAIVDAAGTVTHLDVNPSPAGEPFALGLFSSGSTGFPKLVLRTGEQVVAAANIFAEGIALTDQDRLITSVPLEHSYGIQNVLIGTLLAGGSIVVTEETHPRALWKISDSFGVTILPGAPVFFEMCTRFCAGRPVPQKLRAAISVGSALGVQVHTAFTSEFKISLWQSYGASEAGPISLNRTGEAETDSTVLSLGQPYPGVILKLVEERGIAAGEGELVVHSAAVASRYDHVPEEPSTRIEKSSFYTGDLAQRTPAGSYRFAGRRKLLINTGGHKVDPLEVEQVLKEHPQVADAAVLPQSAGADVDVIRAVIVAKAKIDPEDIASFCSSRMAPHKVPRLIEFRATLPRNELGKLLREKL